MTDEEFAGFMQKLGPAGAGLQSPSQITATGAKALANITANPPAIPSLESPQFAISNAPTGTPGAGRDTLNRFATDAPASKGTTGAIMSVLAPDRPQETLDSSGLNKAIDESMAYHKQRAAEQQENLGKAVATLGNIDATDTEKEAAHGTIQNTPTRLNEVTGNLEVVNPVPTQSSVTDLFKAHGIPTTEGNIRQGQRDLFVSNITPAQTAEGAEASRFANLNVGPSARALQDLGIQFPGTTSKYATAPVFKPDAPPPPQKIERATPVPGQTVDAQGNVVKAPASSIGLTTVKGTEFGQVDNPARGGYTEPNWDVGAWGANISDTKTPMVALPIKVLGQYGNPNDSKFADKFNSKYEVQVVDQATGKTVVASLGDKGPGASTGAGLDMTWATREQLGLKPGFSGNMSYRVVAKGSPLPDNTTPSVQQTAANTGGTTSQQFSPGPVADQIHVNRIDPSTIKDPTIHGSTMTTSEIALWARNQANEYADQMTQAGMPIRMDAYQAQYQKFFDAGQKYQNPEIKLAPVSDQHNQQFQSLSALVSPDATPVGSQLDTLEKYWNDAHKAGFKFRPELHTPLSGPAKIARLTNRALTLTYRYWNNGHVSWGCRKR